MTKVDTSERLARLRKLMADRGVSIYIVPSEDSHSSEYIAACDARREFISGFTGSSGCAVISHTAAVLTTDGRYFNQACQQLDDNWTLLKQGLPDVPTWQEWTATQSAWGNVVAVDPMLLTGLAAKKLAHQLRNADGGELLALEDNLVDMVWAHDRPPRFCQIISVLSDEIAGKPVFDKISDLRQELAKKCLVFFITMLDEIAWLFNLRGSDIPYNPVFFSYATISQDDATLYIDETKLTETCRSHLALNHVQVRSYESFLTDARKHYTSIIEKSGSRDKIVAPPFMISKTGSWALQCALGGDGLVEEIRSPVADAKAVKNESELQGMRACHIRDGVALIRFFAWLEDQLVAKKSKLDEVQAADELERFRSSQRHFIGLSFQTISSTGANAAVIHYKPERGSCVVIEPHDVYLCDSGAQYLDGTTDTTRTIHFGIPSSDEKKAYTLVLKGLIALETAVFPRGTTGFALDCLARQHLWKSGLDYHHGTGHGVGAYLNVHEGPIGIGTRVQYADVPLAPGNVVTNEPGYYEDGRFGIRIENVMLVREVDTENCFGDKTFLGFEHVTMVPYCQNLIDFSLLTATEKEWLNSYNAEILSKTRSFFDDDALTMAWLVRETQPIS